jgi:hypothetical protein
MTRPKSKLLVINKPRDFPQEYAGIVNLLQRDEKQLRVGATGLGCRRETRSLPLWLLGTTRAGVRGRRRLCDRAGVRGRRRLCDRACVRVLTVTGSCPCLPTKRTHF